MGDGDREIGLLESFDEHAYIVEMEKLVETGLAVRYEQSSYYITIGGRVYCRFADFDVRPIPSFVPVRLRPNRKRCDVGFWMHTGDGGRKQVFVFEYLAECGHEVDGKVVEAAMRQASEYQQIDRNAGISKGSIYKLTNTVNGKCYIGQTVQNPSARIHQHLSSANSGKNECAIWKAIRKHGIDAFEFDIVETGIATQKELDAAEQRWIKKCDSVIWHGHGYNMTEGGQHYQFSVRCMFNEKTLPIIRTIISNTTIPFCELARLTGYPREALSAVNSGRTYYDDALDYPLRDPSKSQTAYIGITDRRVFDSIEKDLANTRLTTEQIAEKHHCSVSTVRKINAGNRFYQARYQTDPGKYPIRFSQHITSKELCEITLLLIRSDMTGKDIASKYERTHFAILAISMGQTYVHPMLKYPLNEYSKENQIILKAFGENIIQPRYFAGRDDRKDTWRTCASKDMIEQAQNIISKIIEESHPTVEMMKKREADGIAKPVPGYDGVYYVDIHGNLYGRRRRGPSRDGQNLDEHFSKMSPKLQKNKNGIIYHCEIALRDAQGNRHSLNVSKLVAQLFLPNPNNKQYLRHKDGNVANNSMYNLEWSNEAESHTS